MMDLVGFILGKFQFIYLFKAAFFNDFETTCSKKYSNFFLDFDRFVFFVLLVSLTNETYVSSALQLVIFRFY